MAVESINRRVVHKSQNYNGKLVEGRITEEREHGEGTPDGRPPPLFYRPVTETGQRAMDG